MAAKDFGWFLVFLGIAWFAFTTPLDLTMFNNELILPLGLIIFGAVYITSGFINEPNIKQLVGILFFAFVIIMFRTQVVNWTMPFWTMGQAPLTEHYNSSIIANTTPLKLSCDICDMKVNGSLSNDLVTSIDYNVNSEVIEEVTGNLITIKLNTSHPMGGGRVYHSLPINPGNTMINIGVGSTTINLTGLSEAQSSLNVSTGAGTVRLDGLNGFNEIIINNGVGSIEVWVYEVVGEKTIDLDTGVGSVKIILPEGVEYSLDAHTGLGSVTNLLGGNESTGYDTAADRLLIKAHTGLGSVELVR